MWIVISDTHDRLEKVEKALDLALKREVNRIFHCGDIVSPFVIPLLEKSGIEYVGVFGNNDGDRLLLTKRSSGKFSPYPAEFEVDGKKVLIMHEPVLLDAAVESGRYDFVFYGHTHELVVEEKSGAFVVNPGEACGYLTGKATCVLLDPKEKKWEILEL
ncbi:MAG TPA: metallophosphoesterase [Thermotogae bacterium]|nr:metallophosphoesterase [Thermotogota bacterium]